MWVPTRVLDSLVETEPLMMALAVECGTHS
jgi:hypothetical protein